MRRQWSLHGRGDTERPNNTYALAGDSNPFSGAWKDFVGDAGREREVLRPFDEDRRRRLRHEFNFYLLLEYAHASRKLSSRIAPRCYGAFGCDYMEVIVLDLCDSTLTAWDELSASER